MQLLKFQLAEMEVTMECYTAEMQDTEDDMDDATTKVGADINCTSSSQRPYHDVVGAMETLWLLKEILKEMG